MDLRAKEEFPLQSAAKWSTGQQRILDILN